MKAFVKRLVTENGHENPRDLIKISLVGMILTLIFVIATVFSLLNPTFLYLPFVMSLTAMALIYNLGFGAWLIYQQHRPHPIYSNFTLAYCLTLGIQVAIPGVLLNGVVYPILLPISVCISLWMIFFYTADYVVYKENLKNVTQ